jgi:hypothetical protein
VNLDFFDRACLAGAGGLRVHGRQRQKHQGDYGQNSVQDETGGI